MKALHTIAFILVIIGGLNWLIAGIWTTWDLGSIVTAGVARVVYILVGLSAIYLIATHKKTCKDCCVPDSGSAAM